MTRYEIFLVCWLFFLAGITNAQVYDPVEGQYINPSYIAAQTNGSNIAEQSQSEGILGVDVKTVQLLNIDKETAAAVIIGPVGSPIVGGLAYDPEIGLLYGTDTITKDLVTIDPCDGTTTLIGHTGISLLHGLALDPSDGTLYATNLQSNLYTINKNTGEPNLVGPIGYSEISALDFDPTSGILYGAYASADTTGFLITIDATTGQGTFVADTHRINGLCFDSDGTLYASENGLSSGVQSSLYTVDKFTGEWDLVGGMGKDMADNVLGIEIRLPSISRIQIFIDIRPASCFNPLNTRSKGILPVAVLGTADFDVNDIDLASVRLADVAPFRSNYQDITGPPSQDPNACGCAATCPDGYMDLMLKFRIPDLAQALTDIYGPIVRGDELELTLTGELYDGSLIEGLDFITAVGQNPKRLKMPALNKNKNR